MLWHASITLFSRVARSKLNKRDRKKHKLLLKLRCSGILASLYLAVLKDPVCSLQWWSSERVDWRLFLCFIPFHHTVFGWDSNSWPSNFEISLLITTQSRELCWNLKFAYKIQVKLFQNKNCMVNESLKRKYNNMF